MEFVGWILAAVLAATAGYLALRRNPYPDAVERLTAEVEAGSVLSEAGPEDPTEVTALRNALAREERSELAEGDPGEEALRGLFRFVEGAVLRPLEESLERAGGSRDVRVQNAVDALRDLEFYARQDRKETRGQRGAPDRGGRGPVVAGTDGDDSQDPIRSENLPMVVQAVTREYTRESGVPVRFSGPPGGVQVRIGPERFKDALYLLLANAGHFGGGATVEVEVEADTDEARLRIRDRGTGFSEDALQHAFDPFWSTEPDALGLGLTHARRVLAAQGATLQVGNLEAGGAEAVILISRSG